jgi:hypothetical protein
MNNEPTKEQKDEIAKALMQRASMGKRSGWGYAIKWFAAWEKNFWEKENQKKSLQS